MIAADNLFEFSLADYVDFWRAKDAGASAIAVHQLADPSLASLYGVVELDADDRVVGMEEKPERPRARPRLDRDLPLLAGSPRRARALPRRGAPARPAGSFLAWLCEREPVYGFRFSEAWLDIGDPDSCSRPTTATGWRRGCPARTTYTP